MRLCSVYLVIQRLGMCTRIAIPRLCVRVSPELANVCISNEFVLEHVRMQTHMYAYKHVCMHVQTHMYSYTHTNTYA
jgi:hypothetical protein